MNFDSPDVEKDFPGIYHGEGEDENESKRKKKKKKDKDKGYALFKEEESDQEETELVTSSHVDDLKSPGSKLKKSKPSFRFPTKIAKDKEKEKEKDKEQKRKEKEKERLEKEKAEKQEKVSKKMEKKERKKKKKHSSGSRLGRMNDLQKEETEDRAVFSVPLDVAIERNRLPDGIDLPAVFRECIDDVEERGLNQQGIYRISGVKSKVQKLKDCYNQGKPVYLHDYDPHIVAGLLKLWLRELPEPVLTPDLNSKFDEACALPDEKSKIEKFVSLVELLPPNNKLLLAWTIVHMVHVIEREKINKMSLENVSIVLSPTMKISHRVLNVFFSHSRVFFEDDTIKKYVPTIRHEASRVSLDMPDTPSTIEEELKRQQTILDKLHAELLSGVKDRTKEEELWEVQRVVTTLKRKLRQIKRETANQETLQEKLEAEEKTEAAEKPSEAPVLEAETKETEEEEIEEPAEEEVKAEEETEVGTELEREGSKTPTIELNEEAEAVDVSVAAESATEEEEPEEKIEEKDEEYMDMGHDEGYKVLVEALLEEEQKLVLETEEMNQLGEELRRKIESEKIETERLREEIEEIRLRRAQSLEEIEEMPETLESQEIKDVKNDSVDAPQTVVPAVMTASTGSDIDSYNEGSGSESEMDEQELHDLLQSLIKETTSLFHDKQNITLQIDSERTKCMHYKIQIRLMQWRTERLMILQQKQDEKLLREQPLMPVAASLIHSVTTITEPEQDPTELKDLNDIVNIQGEEESRLEEEQDSDAHCSPTEVTQF